MANPEEEADGGSVVSLNRERITTAISNIQRLDPALAATLQHQNERFAYTAMWDLLQEAQQETRRSIAANPGEAPPAPA